MDGGNLARSVDIAVRALTAVSDMSHIGAVPSIANGNIESHAIGLGQMNLHGYLAREGLFTVRKRRWILPISTFVL